MNCVSRYLTSFVIIVFICFSNIYSSNAQVVALDDYIEIYEDSFGIISPATNDIISSNYSIQKILNFPGNNNVQSINNFTQFLYTPDPNFSGFDTVGYRLCTDAIPPTCDTAIIVIKVLPRADTPVARPDTIYMFEDTDTLISVLNNDYDIDGDSLFILVPVGPQHAQTATNVLFKKIYYKPVANYYGVDSMRYTACDDQDFSTTGLCSPLTLVYIVIIPVNDPPIAVDDRDTLNEDQSKCISVLNNDINVDGNLDKLNLTALAATPKHGTAIIQGTQICYTPSANYYGNDTIKYIVCDTATPQLCDTGFIYLTVLPINDKPVAGDDNYTIQEDKDTCFAVMLNDSDVDGNPIVITGIIDQPGFGTASINGNTICYFPNDNYNGKDTLIYVITDNANPALKDTARVIITITPVEDAPNAVNDNATIPEDGNICVSVLTNDIEVDGDPIIVSGTVGNPRNGTAQVVGNQVCYTPNPNFNGIDTVKVIVCDNKPSGKCDTSLLIITVTPVNDAPNANNDIVSTNEDTQVCVNVLSNDQDVDGDPIIISNTSGPSHGSVNVNGGLFCYTPASNYNGKDTIRYVICENKPNGLCDTALLVITVIPVEDAPIAVDDFASTSEDAQVCVSVLNNDIEVDGDPLVVSGTFGGPKNGQVQVVGNQVCYTPNANFDGKDTIRVVVCDNKPSGKCDTSLLVINVNAVNDPPIANNDNVTTNEDVQVCVNVLTNDIEPDGDIITITSTQGPSHGTVNILGGQFCYIPSANYNGKDTIRYIICDNNPVSLCDTAILVITVVPVEDAPIAVDDIVTIPEDGSICVSVLNNDLEVDGDVLVVSGTFGGPKKGSVQVVGNQVCYTPNPNFNGADTIRVIVCDNKPSGKCDTSLLVINVTPLNDAPIANDDNISTNEDTQVCFNVLNNDSEPDGDQLTVTIIDNPNHGTITNNGVGSYCYVPSSNYNGKDTLIYVICENRPNGLCDTAKVVITVNPVEDAPQTNNDVLVVPEDGSGCINVLANDIEVDGDNIVISGTVGQPAHGTVQINGNQVCYTPAPNYNGQDTVKVIICDNKPNGKCDTSLLIITVTPINDPPVANDNIVVTNEDTQICVSVLNNDADIDGPAISVSGIYGGNHGTVFVQGNQVCYNPFPNYNGPDTVFYVVCDNGNPNLCDTARLIITVAPVNDKPIAVNDIVNGVIGQPVSFNILTNDSDPDGDPLTISIIDQPNSGSISVSPTGQVTYTPAPGFSGVDTFVYQICDPGGLCDTATVYVQYLDLTNVIIANDECVEVNEDQSITINVLQNDLVDPNQTITMTLTCQPRHGQATVINNQVFYQPSANYNGSDSLCYRICFPNNTKCDEARVCITIMAVADAPIANPDFTTTDTITSVQIDVQANDIDVDGEGIVTSSIVDQPNHGIATVINGDSVLYTPQSGFVGYDTLIYQLCKFGYPNLCDTSIVVIVVGNPNNPPVAVTDSIRTVIDLEQTINVLTNDYDPDGDDITVTVVNNPINGTVQNNGNGQVVYTPDPGYYGLDSFTYVICDNGFITLCDTGTVVIEIFKVKVPNSISPNGDNNNDVLEIEGLEFYPDNYLKIFNRWGDIVFSADQYQNNWSGQLENAGLKIGDIVPNGTYFYILYLNEALPVIKGYIMVEK